MKINKRLIATVLAIMLIVGIFAQTSFVAFATTEGENGGDLPKTIVSIAELDASILSQTFDLNSTETPVLPEKLTATIADLTETEDVAVTWAADPAFNVAAAGTYTYTAALAEGYVLGADVTLPNITLVVVDNSTPLVPLENAEENSETEQGDGSGIMPMSGEGVPVPASDTVVPVASYVGDTTKTLDAIYANGVPIRIESAGEENTQIRYDSDGSGAVDDGDDLLDLSQENEAAFTSANLTNVKIYGGTHVTGNAPYEGSPSTTGSTSVTMTGGIVYAIYGGGHSDGEEGTTDGKVDGNTNVTMQGGLVINAIYGGGYKSPVSINTNVTMTGGAVGYFDNTPSESIDDAVAGEVTYYANVYGGGYEGQVDGTANVTIKGGVIGNSVFGGGYMGTTANTNVLVEGGTVGKYTLTANLPNDSTPAALDSDGVVSLMGNVFGGGYGDKVDTTKVTIDGGTLADLSNPPHYSEYFELNVYNAVIGNVFGGGIMSTVGVSANVEINGGNIGGQTINTSYRVDSLVAIGNVFGSGILDLEFDHDADSPFDVVITINNGATIRKTANAHEGTATGNVFGGGYNGYELSFVGTSAIYYLDGTVEGNLIASGLGYSRVGTSTLFINDDVSEAEFDGNVYLEYLSSDDARVYDPIAVIENTWTEVGSQALEENDSGDGYVRGETMLNASQKLAINNYYNSSDIINPYEIMNVLRLQEFTDDVDGDGKTTHWAMVGHVDISTHDTIQNNIAFANNQELYIYGYHLLNAPAFVATAATNGGYIITEKEDITDYDFEYSDESDIDAHIYRGYFTGELDVSGGNTYVLNASPVTALTANPSVDLQDFLGIKFAGSDGRFDWEVDSVANGTDDATVTPDVDEVGTFTHLAKEKFAHKFDSVYLSDDDVFEPNRMPANPRFNIDLSGWADGQTDVIVVADADDIIPVEFKKEPIDDDSAPIHETNTTVGGKINPPTDEEIEEIPFKPDAWTTTPNDESTKWEFSDNVSNDDVTDNKIILYPYYEQWIVIFEDDNFSDSTIHHVEKVDKDGETVSKPTTDPTSSGKNFVGWYTDETLTTEYNFNTLVTGNMTLYPKFENISTGGSDGDPDPEVHKPEEEEEEEVEEWTVTFEDENFNDNKTHDEETVTDGETVDPPSKDPVSEDDDKKFVGWYEDEDLTDPYEFDDPVTEDITLYPKFEDKDTVSVTYEKDEDGTDDTKTDIITGLEPGTNITVDNNGGTNPGFDGDVTVDQDITVPNPTKPGNIFTGYEKEVDPETGDITITATWKPDDSFTVTFEDNNFDDDKIHHEEDVPSGEKVKEPSTPTPPSDDEKFVGWFEDEDFNEYYVFDDPVTEDITLYPKFEDKDTVSVTYEKDQDGTDDTKTDIITGLEPGTNITVDNNGGTNPGFDGDITIDVDTIIPDPTKEGSIFTGYEKDVDEDGNITITATWKDTVDVTFNEYTDGSANTQPGGITGLPIGTVITVDNAGGTNPGFDGDITINVDTIIPDPTREGYIFTGYVESEDGNGKIIITATWLSEEETPFQPELPPVEGLDVLETPDGPIYVHPDGTPLTYEELVDIFGEDIPLGALEGLGLDEFGMPLGGLDLDGFNPTGSLPQTGDESKLLLYFFSGSMMLLAGVVVNTTRKTKE